MWVSKKRFKELEKRVADLEKAVQSQPQNKQSTIKSLVQDEEHVSRMIQTAGRIKIQLL